MSGLAISATRREDFGKGAIRRLRKTGQMPAVVYGGDDDAEPVSVQIRHDSILHSLENEAFYSSILKLELDGETQKVVLRDVQRHPATIQILHADFQRVSSKSEITMVVPVHYLNAETAEGVKTGGEINVLMSELSIHCLAKDLPESIAVDVVEMEIGDSVSLLDVVLPKGVALTVFNGMTEEEMEAHNQVIVALNAARTQEEEEETSEAVVEAGDVPSGAEEGDDDKAE